MIEWTQQGIRIEADQRHAEIIIEHLGLLNNAKGVSTPYENKESNQEELERSGEDSTLYLACVARADFLSQDRSDIQYAVKELSRSMSTPTQSSMAKLKRLGRYLHKRFRHVRF